jgi:hypothetical protein
MNLRSRRDDRADGAGSIAVIACEPHRQRSGGVMNAADPVVQIDGLVKHYGKV